MSDIRKRNGAKGITYQVRYPSTATKSGYAYKTFNSMKEARAFKEDAYAKRTSNGINCEISTVHQAIDKWLDICEKIGRDGRERVEPETFKQYQGLAKHINEYQWEKPLQEIETVDVVHFRNWLLENKSRVLSRKVLTALHSVLIEMKQHGYIKDDPASGVSIKSFGRVEEYEKEKDIPSDSDIKNILRTVDMLANEGGRVGLSWARYKPMVYLAIFSGMRPSEYRGLSWDNVYENRIEIRQRADKAGRIGAVKSKAGVRTIYLPQVVIQMLFEWKKSCYKSESNLVFPTYRGNPQTLSSIRTRVWCPLMKVAGLTIKVSTNGTIRENPKYTMYSLRHYFASKLIEKGTDFKIIQETMGHSKIEMTFNIYGHLLKNREGKRLEIAEQLACEILDTSYNDEHTA